MCTHIIQVFVPVDKSLGEVWKVRVLSGGNSSEEVFVQASCVEEFTAPVFFDSLSQIYHIKKTIGRYNVYNFFVCIHVQCILQHSVACEV